VTATVLAHLYVHVSGTGSVSLLWIHRQSSWPVGSSLSICGLCVAVDPGTLHSVVICHRVLIVLVEITATYQPGKLTGEYQRGCLVGDCRS